MILDKENITAIGQYLLAKGLVKDGETVLSAEKPGEGNMNYTLRIKTADQSLIMKQARPYVEKYPQIPAPIERIIAEGTFYQLTKDNEVIQKMMPGMLLLDEQNHILVMEDAGLSNDFTSVYKKGKELSSENVKALAAYLTELHQAFNEYQTGEVMANRNLRKLNHEHIFIYPLMKENGFDLDPVQEGLAALANPLKQNNALKKKAEALGNTYLADGRILLHGDFYPGSWLKTDDGLKVIDPEFCYFGTAEFDLGIVLAHFYMSQQPDHLFELFQAAYENKAVDQQLVNDFSGIEIIRRIIGLAQLPLDLNLTEKEALLKTALMLLNIEQHGN